MTMNINTTPINATTEEEDVKIEILDLNKLLNMTEASASRAASYLSEVGYRGKKGLGFIWKEEEDVMDRRKKKLRLTMVGKSFLITLDNTINGVLQRDSRKEKKTNA